MSREGSFESDGRLVSQTSRFLYLEEVADTLLQEVREYGNGVRNVQSSLLYRLVLYGARFLYTGCPRRLTFIMLFGLSPNDNHSGAKLSTRQLDPFNSLRSYYQRSSLEFRDQDEHKK
jgi:hypothetical protein